MPRKKKEATEEVAARLSAKTPRIPPVPPEDLLSTGCAVLNLAVSGTPGGGIPKGNYYYIVGDSSTGKTWLAFNLYAEAARNKHFADYRFVFDNAENGALMDVGRYFGKAVAARLEPPSAYANGTPYYSRTAQEFYYHLDSNVARGPCIYVLDSMDALNDDADEEKFDAEVSRFQTGKGKVPGSMGMAKAKTNSKNINRVAQSLRASGSILAVVSQTRDKLNSHIPGLKTRGGGHALKFFAHVEVWFKIRERITVTHHGKDRVVGDKLLAEVRKNRVTGWEGKVPLISFLKGYGVDDVGTSIDYLLEERHWKYAKGAKKAGEKGAFADEDDGGGPFSAPEFGFEGGREELVAKIQGESLEWELNKLAAATWAAVAAATAPRRLPKYG